MNNNMINNNNMAIDTGFPLFPAKREEFDNYKFLLDLYLEMRGLMNVVTNATSSLNGNQEAEKAKNNDSKNEEKNKSSSSTQQAFSAESKRAYNIIIMSLSRESKQIDLVKGIPRGDAAAVYKKLVDTYGVVQSSSNQSLIIEKLNDATKLRSEPIEEFIARMDTMFRHLRVCGTSLDLAMQKYYILNALKNLDEWKLTVKLIKTKDIDNKMSMDDMIRLLINEDNDNRIDSDKNKSNKSDSNSSSSFYTHDNNKNNNRNRNNNQSNNNNNNYSITIIIIIIINVIIVIIINARLHHKSIQVRSVNSSTHQVDVSAPTAHLSTFHCANHSQHRRMLVR